MPKAAERPGHDNPAILMSQADPAPFVSRFPLKAHNTFGFDVRARLACRIEHEEQLAAAMNDPRAAGLPRLVLGGGSNVVLTGDFGARPARRP